MPQLDLYLVFPQVVWFGLLFLGSYYILARLVAHLHLGLRSRWIFLVNVDAGRGTELASLSQRAMDRELLSLGVADQRLHGSDVAVIQLHSLGLEATSEFFSELEADYEDLAALRTTFLEDASALDLELFPEPEEIDSTVA